ncbi:hypothetical protein [Pseudomonas viridiflava]|uniref:hypothetical protein n=1 Tax=Pseudomonas viridiflava TaxID=33069 RepID=UPI0018E5FD7D|nr:hypothetical protein [Pseudomonas viridiflava]MBI6705394.1 hypothetical protein [Pseudomonas viridiflava]MBI6725363.1 hypothetical protein [Pseudomonas viridiflava]
MSQTVKQQTAIVFGSWKIRHQEPLQAQDYALHAISSDVALIGTLTAVADTRGCHPLIARWSTDGCLTRGSLGEMHCSNLGEDALPLAVVTMDAEQIYITHLLHRLDVHRSLFVQPPLPIDQPSDPAQLVDALRRGFERNHLAINNWECRYSHSEHPYVEVFELDSDCHARMLGEAWFDNCSTPSMRPFTSQCGDEFQIWDYHVTPARTQEGGYIWVEHCSRRRKLAIDEPLARLFHSAPGVLAGSRQEVSLGLPALDAMAMSIDCPLQALGEYRSYVFSVPCESVESGNLFTVTFETCTALTAGCGRTTRGEVRFLKSRGDIDPVVIGADLQGLMTRLGEFLKERRQFTRPFTDRFAFLRSASPLTTMTQESLHS